MTHSLKTGITTTHRWTIGKGRTISFMGDEGRVYATPNLVRDIEATCRNLLLSHLGDGDDSVGTGIAIRHTAPTLLGMWADISVSVIGLNGNAVTFKVEARDALDVICTGTHDRYIVQVGQTVERLKSKAAKLKTVA